MVNVFIIGLRGYTQDYGGWETFVHGLINNWTYEDVHFYAFEKVKSKSEECIVEVDGVTCIRISEQTKGSSAMMRYDAHSLDYTIKYVREHGIENPVAFILGMRIGPYVMLRRNALRKNGIATVVNPAGIEWKRTKWGKPVQVYLLVSALTMAVSVDCLACDSRGVLDVYDKMLKIRRPRLTYATYGAEKPVAEYKNVSVKVKSFLEQYGLEPDGYYLVVGRFVPENNYEMMLKGFMLSNTSRKLLIITNIETELGKFRKHIEDTTHYKDDGRIVMAGTLYDQEILQYLRFNAHGYIHGHSVGGTNPGLLEAMSATKLNILYDVPFNKEVGGDACLYFIDKVSLAHALEIADGMDCEEIDAYGKAASNRMETLYSWSVIAGQYHDLFTSITV